MARIPPDVMASVARFLAVVRQRLQVDAAHLYGSQAVGSAGAGGVGYAHRPLWG
jgi:hypothetical protein